MKSTKKSLLLSTLSLIMCVAMLLGTTYAWFTDSVTSGKNIIKSGNLDIEMYYADGTKAVPAADSTDWKDASNVAIFDYDLWEPGYTEVYHIKIANVGTLALKYQLSIATDGEVGALADVLDVYAIPTATQVADRSALTDTYKVGTMSDVLTSGTIDVTGNLMPKGSKDASGNDATYENTLTLAVKMQETAGNEYKGLSIGDGFNVVVKATQYTYEEDSFNNQYDKDAEYPVCEHENMSKESYVLKNGKLYYYCPDCFEKVALTDTEFAALAGKVLVKNGDTLSVSDKTLSQLLSTATNGLELYLANGDYTPAQIKNTSATESVKVTITGLNDKDGNKAAFLQLYNPADTETNGFYFRKLDITVRNLNLVGQDEDANGDSRHGAGFVYANSLLVEDCVFTKSQCLWNEGATYTIKNSTFNCSDLGDKYAMWTRGNGTWNFENCTFNTNGKAIKLYHSTGTANVTGCTFNVTNQAATKAAVQNDAGSGLTVTVTGCTNNGHVGGLTNK